MNINETIKKIGLVPVVVFNSVEETIPTLEAMEKGDVPVAEICFRTPCAAECIKLAAKEFGDKFLIGAGTVINAKQCKEAIKCGAKFIVSPGFSITVARVCKSHKVPYFPGVATGTEIMLALEFGLTTLKFFPASVYGGLKGVKALSAAFPQVSFIPTGGVNNENLKEFLEFNKIFAVGGSWMVKGSPEEITKQCLEARKIVKGVR